ncbi:hypothetical protein EDB92DRAFT_1837246 [Lactarius akahatsu]|uniref:Uncharacterized protein n=1 Tax=Lactarius akahatsu TaxID=416441 RepID=A0AAD4LLZ9_9AGAM|nr:hypothetical protein EDB92DRAFT_1837246 [Lactarius akahatsu]
MCRGGFYPGEKSWGWQCGTHPEALPVPESLRSESPRCRRNKNPAAGGVTAPTPISVRLSLPLLLLGHAGTADAEVGAVAEVGAETDTRGLGIRRPLCACGKGHSDTSFSLVTFFRPNLGGLRVASYWPVRSSRSSVLSEEEMCGRWASRRTLNDGQRTSTTIPSTRGGLVNAVGSVHVLVDLRGAGGARTVCKLCCKVLTCLVYTASICKGACVRARTVAWECGSIVR